MHHTGRAKLENPDAMTQFLAAEALSRARSLLFVARGDQFGLHVRQGRGPRDEGDVEEQSSVPS